MNIEPGTWHYKIVMWNKSLYDRPNNVCAYIRQFLAQLGIAFLLVVALSALSVGLIVALVHPILYLWDWAFGNDFFARWTSANEFLWGGIAIYAIILYCLIALAYEEIKARRRFAREHGPEKSPSVFKVWYQDLKAKTCSHITYTNEEVK